MISLKDLQEAGSLSSSYKEVSLRGANHITLKQIESLSEEELSRFRGIVILDNAKWVATIGRKPPAVSKIVISCDGELIGSWHKERRSFFVQQLTDKGELATFNQIRLPESSTQKRRSADMAQDVNLQGLNIDELTKGVNSAATVPAETETTKAPSKTEIAVTEIKQMINQRSTVNLAERSSAVLFNQQFGRAFGFICRTDKAIKLSKVSEDKLIDGKPVWKPDTPATVIENYEKTGKGGASYREKNKKLVFKEAKPTAPVAMIIGTPEGGDFDLTQMNSEASISPDRSKTSLKFHILPMETAYVVLAAQYDGKIKEDDAVLGTKATWLTVKSTASKRDDATDGATLAVRNSLTINKKNTGSRTTVLTTGNYIPLREYQTIPVSNITTQEDVAALNLNFEAALKDKKVEVDFPSNAGAITQAADGTVTSKYFSVGGGDATLFGDIFKFDSKTETVSTIEIPAREKVPTKKDPSKFTYKYVFRDWDSVKSRPEIISILKAIGMDPDTFKAEADKTTRRASTSKKTKNQLSADDILKLQFDTFAVKQNCKDDIRSIAQKLAGIE